MARIVTLQMCNFLTGYSWSCGKNRLCVTPICSANTAERIGVPLGVEALGDPRNIVLDGSFEFLHF